MKTTLLSISIATLLGSSLALAQSTAPPPPASAPPPVDTSMPPPPSAPPVNTSTPPVNTAPPPIGTPQNNGQPNPNTQQDVPRDANGNPLPSTAVMGGSQVGQPAAPQPLDFGMLDADKAGALKIEQARNDPWLRQHFAACDVNHNDEVTKSEYEKCSGR